MAAGIVIRQAVPDDYDQIIASVDTWWGGRSMAAMLPRLFFLHFRPWTFVAERGDRILGFLAGLRSQTDPAQFYCHFIGVHPEARAQGIGEALYQRLFADAAMNGGAAVLAVTSPRNHSSVAFHRRMGFEVLPGPGELEGVSYTPGYDGPGEDRVRLRKPLVRVPASDAR
jgi:ribosomal protein S18 acetylase RimI-like enzyme